jgi:hypothetical protein
VLYDAYMSAADAILGIENQPRARGVDLLEKENGYLIAKAWTVAEQLARLQPSADGREAFVKRSSIARSKWATGSTARTRF